MDSYTVTNFGALASRLSVAHVVEVYRHAMAQPNWTPAVTQFLTEFVTHGVFIAILFYHFSMKWFEHKFTDRSLYEKRKGFWKKLMAGYNLVLSLYSLVTFFVTLSSLRAMGMYGPECGALFSNSSFDWAARLFYYSKYVEFADTWFLVIAGKPVSWLQYFHHAGACLDMWVLYRFQNEGIWLFVQFNSFIHTIMYAYFACTALGINVPGKQVVTLLQILQLTIGNSLAFVYPAQACYAADPFRLIGWAINFVYINCLVVLFVHFAVTTYILPSKSSKAGKGKGKGLAQAKAVNGNGNGNGEHVNGNGNGKHANGNGHTNGAGEH